MRNRLVIGVLAAGVAVLGAGVPALTGAVRELAHSQELLAEAELGRRAVLLSHALADERDILVTESAARDGSGMPEGVLPGDVRARADERTARLREELPLSLRGRLDTLAGARERALSGEEPPAGTHAVYTAVIEELDGIARDAYRSLPARASAPTADALPDLVRAVSASSATRGLLLAGLLGEGEQRDVTALAHRARARETAALADFAALADEEARQAYGSQVAGTEVTSAEEYLEQLTSAPYVTAEARRLDRQDVSNALATRTGLQRSVLSELTDGQVHALEELRDQDMTAFQLRVALVTAALLLAVGSGVHTARSLTRPLAAVRLGSRRVAADPTGGEPVRFTGRNDEFADVVTSVNALRAHAVTLHRSAAEAGRDIGALRAERERLRQEQRELSGRLSAVHSAVHGTFAHHAERILTLVGEQLMVLEGLERHETDPDHLGVLFQLDHLAARVRRHGENLLLLAGTEPAPPGEGPVELIDVLRAAVSEIEQYELVEAVPPNVPAALTGPVARDIGHLLAELLDNATASSPEGTRVRLSARNAANGLSLHVDDEGHGLSPDRLTGLNARLADPGTLPPAGGGMGLYTVARLAARHGLNCRLRPRPGGGISAEVDVPGALLVPLVSSQGATPAPAGAGTHSARTPGEGARTDHIPGHGPEHGGAAPPATGRETPVRPSWAGHTPPSGTPTGPERSGTGAAGAAGEQRSPGRHAGRTDGSAPPEHARADGTGPWPAQQVPPAAQDPQATRIPHTRQAPPESDGSRTTASGLPLRTPGAPASAGERSAGAAAASGSDPEELRRRLGGFQRGAREGHRDADAQTTPGPTGPHSTGPHITGEETPS